MVVHVLGSVVLFLGGAVVGYWFHKRVSAKALTLANKAKTEVSSVLKTL